MPFFTKNRLSRTCGSTLFCVGLFALFGCSTPPPPAAQKVSSGADSFGWGSAAPAIPPVSVFADVAPSSAIDDPVLERLFRSAAQNSPRMAEQELNIVQNDAFRFRGWRQHLPYITAAYRFGYFKLVRGDNRGNDENTGGTYSVDLRYPVFQWGAIQAEKDAAYRRESRAMLGAEIAWRQLVAQIRYEYYQAIVLKNDIELKKLQIDLETRRSSRAGARNEAGAISSNDHVAQGITLRRLNAELRAATADLANLVASIRSTTGLDDFSVAMLPETVKPPKVDPDALLAQFNAFALETNSETLAARYAREHSEETDAEITQARARMLPNFNLGASIAQTPVQTNTNRFEMQTVLFAGISGFWNIFDREATVTSVRALETRKRLIKRQLQSQNTYRALQLTSQLSQIRSLLQQADVRRGHLENARRTLDEMRQRLSHGMTEQIAVEDAELNVVSIERGIFNDQVSLTRAYHNFQSEIEQDPAATLYTAPPNTR